MINEISPTKDPLDERELLELDATIEKLFKESEAIQKKCSDHVVKKAMSHNFEILHPWNLSYRPSGSDISEPRRLAPMSDFAFGQLCAKIGVPVAYMRKCIEAEEFSCVVDNMNTWIDLYKRDLFIREHNNQVRGVLSTKYSVLDTPNVLDVLFDSNLPFGNFDTRGYYVSPERFHLRLTEPTQLFEKDDLFAGVQIDSSDVGRSQLKVQFFLYKLVCTNGMVSVVKGEDGKDKGGIFFQQKHIGISKDDFRNRLVEALGNFDEFRDEAILTIKKAKEQSIFTNDELYDGNVKEVQQHTRLREEQAKEVIEVLSSNRYDYTLWGLANAMTDWAQKFTLERRLEIERNAGLLVAA